MKKAWSWVLNNIDNCFGSVCSAIMIVLLFVQVVTRFVIRHSLTWTEEIALPLFILSIYYGAASAVKRNQHLRIVVLIDNVGPLARLIFDIIADIVSVGFMAFVSFAMVKVTSKLFNTGAKLVITGVSKWIIYALVLIGFALMIIRFVEHIFTRIHEYNGIKKEVQ